MEDPKTNGNSRSGKARAESLSPERRSEIAKIAANAKWHSDYPKAKFDGVIKIAGVEIPCAVHEENGNVRRFIVQRQVVGLLTGNKKGGLDRYLKAENLQPFIPEKFKNKSLDQVATVLEIRGKKAHCYEGEDVVDLCKMYLDARKAAKENGSKYNLLPTQLRLADKAEIIITSLAKVGIAGLIDEATGYQNVRSKDALQAYLEKVLRKELAAWVQRFPNEFFNQIYRLRKWNSSGNHKRFRVTGRYVKDIVYSRLGPGILKELENLNPKNLKGRRSSTHHQWLTEDIGNPALAQHLYAVTGLMKVSDSWQEFIKNLNRAFPKREDIDLIDLT